MRPMRIDEKHCHMRCPYYLDGKARSFCEKHREIIHFSREGNPMQLPMCAANAAYEKAAAICDSYSHAGHGNYADSCAKEIRKKIT